MTCSSKARNPFVGLRPFDSDNSLYYFGRNEQTRTLIQQLHLHRFLAVVGASGSGKSSLVRAGLIPILESGFLVQDRDSWNITTMKPGVSPLSNLAAAILDVPGVSKTEDAAEVLLDKIQTRGVAAILEEIEPFLEERQANLLLLVDQFEELFRFASRIDDREEAADFVNILLRLSRRPGSGIYVVLTMRSDFIGDCDRFQGLPEAMNRSQYLVPRLTRKQRREAIAGPIRLAGGTAAPRLVERLLNANIDARDDLPILQHALMRTWENWAARGAEGPVDLEHLDASGGIADALKNHADEALAELNEEDRAVAKRIFQALTETDAGNRTIRRPAHLSEIAEITGSTPERVETVLGKFSGQGRYFLADKNKPGEENALVDIAHESFIRQWDRLRKWVEEEAESAKTYRRLAETAELHAAGRAGLYRGIDLELAQEWMAESLPTRAWGARYHPGYDSAMEFLANSRKTHEEELARAERERRRRVWARRTATAAVIVILSAIAVYAWKEKRFAERQHRMVNYKLAKQIEEEATEALQQMDTGGREYREAWLSALVSLNQPDLPEDAVFPDSMGMLCRRDLAAGALANIWTSPAVNAAMRCAVFRPDGRYIVSGSAGGELTLWHYPSADAAPRKVEAVAFTAAPGMVYDAVFSPDGAILATVSGENIRIWDFSNPEEPRELNPLTRAGKKTGADVRALAFSFDGKTLAAGAEDDSIRLWDFSDPESPRNLEFKGTHGGTVYTVAFSPDGRYLASGSEDKTIRIWELARPDSVDPLKVLMGHRNSVSSVTFSPDGRTLASGARETSILIWDVSNPTTATELARIDDSHAESVARVAFNADGTILASASWDRSIGLWDLSDPAAPKRRSRFEGHLSYIYAANFSADGLTLLSASEDSTVRLWDLSLPDSLARSTGHTEFVNSIAVSSDGEILASGGRDNTARLWALSPSGAPRELSVLREHGDFVYAVAISPDGKILATGSRDTNIRLFDIEDPSAARLVSTMKGDESGVAGHSSWVLAVAFGPGGKTLASGSFDETLRVWDLADPAKPRLSEGAKDFENFDDLVSTVAFSRSGRTLAAGSYDKTFRIYDFGNPGAPRELLSLKGDWPQVSSVSFSPDGALLATGLADGTVRFWNISDRSSPREVAQLKKHGGPVTSVTFSPDGNLLASASADQTIRLWDLAEPDSPLELAVLRGHTNIVTSVAFSQDGASLYSGSRDNSIRVWRLAGPFNDYRRDGKESPAFQKLYRVSFKLLPFRLEGISLVPEDTLPEIPGGLEYRPPGMPPFDWIRDSAAE